MYPNEKRTDTRHLTPPGQELINIAAEALYKAQAEDIDYKDRMEKREKLIQEITNRIAQLKNARSKILPIKLSKETDVLKKIDDEINALQERACKNSVKLKGYQLLQELEGYRHNFSDNPREEESAIIRKYGTIVKNYSDLENTLISQNSIIEHLSKQGLAKPDADVLSILENYLETKIDTFFKNMGLSRNK